MTPFADSLRQSIHPEIAHLRAGRHPGKQWWLKTICPDPYLPRLDVHGFGQHWKQFWYNFPLFIRITDIAFDWSNNRLPYTWTVWVYDGMDVRMECKEQGKLLLSIVDDTTGLKEAIEQLQLLEEGDENVYNALENEIRNKESELARQQLQVIHGKLD